VQSTKNRLNYFFPDTSRHSNDYCLNALKLFYPTQHVNDSVRQCLNDWSPTCFNRGHQSYDKLSTVSFSDIEDRIGDIELQSSVHKHSISYVSIKPAIHLEIYNAILPFGVDNRFTGVPVTFRVNIVRDGALHVFLQRFDQHIKGLICNDESRTRKRVNAFLADFHSAISDTQPQSYAPKMIVHCRPSTRKSSHNGKIEEPLTQCLHPRSIVNMRCNLSQIWLGNWTGGMGYTIDVEYIRLLGRSSGLLDTRQRFALCYQTDVVK